MDLNDWLSKILYRVGAWELTTGKVIVATFFTVLILLLSFLWFKRILPVVRRRMEPSAGVYRQLMSRTHILLIALLILNLFLSSGWDHDLFTNDHIVVTLRRLIVGLFLLVVVAWLEVLIGRLIERFHQEPDHAQLRTGVAHPRSGAHDGAKIRRQFAYLLYCLWLLVALKIYSVELAYQTEVGLNDNRSTIVISLFSLVLAIFIVLVTRLLIWVAVRFFLSEVYRRQEINVGAQFAINQLFRYLLYFLALLIILRTLGVSLTLVAGGTAALLLGVGLGLQQTFNDFFSGILLLFERSVEVGDVVEISGLVGTVKSIGLRTSQVQTRDNKTVIVPNSNLVVNKVENWSYNDEIARFTVNVGVAYGSDTQLVKDLLIQAAGNHPKILKYPKPFVRFSNFGNSSLDFEIHFWSMEFMQIEDVMSDLRFRIDALFREHHITIPFPQRDIWIRSEKE